MGGVHLEQLSEALRCHVQRSTAHSIIAAPLRVETRLKRSCHGADSNPQLGGNRANGEPLGAESGNAVAVEDLPGSMWGEFLSGAAVDRLANLSSSIIVPVSFAQINNTHYLLTTLRRKLGFRSSSPGFLEQRKKCAKSALTSLVYVSVGGGECDWLRKPRPTFPITTVQARSSNDFSDECISSDTSRTSSTPSEFRRYRRAWPPP